MKKMISYHGKGFVVEENSFSGSDVNGGNLPS